MAVPFWISALLVLGFLNMHVWGEVSHASAFQIHFFDVGQGDAILLESRQGHRILIDGGRDEAVLEKLGGELPFWRRDLDLVVATHPDADHIGGLAPVLEHYEGKNILWTGMSKDTGVFGRFARALEGEGAETRIARSGQAISWGTKDALAVLAPIGERESMDSNESSIMLHLSSAGSSALFTGDATKSVERELLARGLDRRADILQAGHHGSKTSSSPAFVAAVNPSIAVISSGKDNRYGHPHQETIETFASFGIEILRTDRDGDITLLFSD